MDYENIIEVIELEYYSEVNKYLKCGWILLSASAAVAPYGDYGVQKKSIYSIGWDKKNGEVQYPISEKSQEEVLIEAVLNGDYSAIKEITDEWNAGD